MDYRYLLFFERAQHLTALERLAAMAEPYEGPTELVLPDRSVSLPFSVWLETAPRLRWDDTSRSWDFMTVLCFEPDGAIEDYLDDPAHHDAQGRATVGVVYLSVRRDMTDWASGSDKDLVMFELGTPGSSMSILFQESDSIRRSFVDLLASSGGVYGVFDQEDFADVFWLHGREVDVRVPIAELPLSEVEELVAATGSTPLSFRADEVVATARHLRRASGGAELGVHHWLLALLDSDVPLAGRLAALDAADVAQELRRRLGSRVVGDPLPEEEVLRRANEWTRRTGEDLVTAGTLAEVVADAAGSVSL